MGGLARRWRVCTAGVELGGAQQRRLGSSLAWRGPGRQPLLCLAGAAGALLHSSSARLPTADILAVVHAALKELSRLPSLPFPVVISVVEARVVKLLQGHTKEVAELAAVPAAPRLLASLSRDGNLRLWDLPSETCLASLQTDGTCLVRGGGGAAGRAGRRAVRPGAALRACARLPRLPCHAVLRRAAGGCLVALHHLSPVLCLLPTGHGARWTEPAAGEQQGAAAAVRHRTSSSGSSSGSSSHRSRQQRGRGNRDAAVHRRGQQAGGKVPGQLPHRRDRLPGETAAVLPVWAAARGKAAHLALEGRRRRQSSGGRSAQQQRTVASRPAACRAT